MARTTWGETEVINGYEYKEHNSALVDAEDGQRERKNDVINTNI